MRKNQAQSRIMGIYYSTKERLASMVAWIPRQRRKHASDNIKSLIVENIFHAAEEEDPALNLDVAEAAKPSEIVVEPRGILIYISAFELRI